MSETTLRAAVGVWAPVLKVPAGPASLAVGRHGNGPPVICLHATGHGGRDFEHFADRVGSRFEVIAVDWPGQGHSPSDGTPASAAHYADLLESVVPQLTREPPILLGNSIGAAAALIYAARWPERVRALVLCNPGGLAPLDATARAFIKGMVAFFRAGSAGARWFPAAFRAYYRLVLPGRPARVQRGRIVAACMEVAPVLAEAWRSFAQPDSDLRQVAEGLQVPVLYAWAKDDRVVAWSRSKAAVLRTPHHRVEMFRGGHAPFLEDPDAFAQCFIAYAQSEIDRRKSHGEF